MTEFMKMSAQILWLATLMLDIAVVAAEPQIDSLSTSSEETNLREQSNTETPRFSILLSNPTDQSVQQIIQFDSHLLNEVRASWTQLGAPESARNGRQVPIAERPMPSTLIRFPFTLGAFEQLNVQFETQSHFQGQLTHRVLSPQQARQHEIKHLSIRLVIAGGLITLLLYNVLLAAVNRSQLYWIYSAVLFISTLSFVQQSRLVEFLGLLSDWKLSVYATMAFFATGLAFIRHVFSETQTTLTRRSHVLGWLLLGFSLLLSHHTMVAWLTIVIIPSVCVLIIFNIAHAWHRRHPLAAYVALGWGLYFLSLFITSMALQGKLAPQFSVAYGLGNLVEGLVFSGALALRLRNSEQYNQKLAEKLKRQLHTDPLTNLMNRDGIHAWFDQHTNRPMGLLLLNIDGFKSVNMTFGHRYGDHLLQNLANTIQTKAPPGSAIGRLTSDEFTVLIPHFDWDQTRQLAKELLDLRAYAQAENEELLNRHCSLCLSAIEGSETLSDALRTADIGLKKAKALGGGRWIEADEAFKAQAIEQGAYITDLEIEAALLQHEFHYYLQPIYQADSEHPEIEGFEALIRWIKPSGKVLLPSTFACKFDAVFFGDKFQYIRQSMRRKVIDAVRPFGSVYISWNFSIDQLSQSAFVEQVAREFKDLDWGLIKTVIEISERGQHFELQPEQLTTHLNKLREHGFLIALDDFGVEHSNLDRLTDLPLDIVKLDRSFVRKNESSARSQVIFFAIVSLCKLLHLKLIAEGIETRKDMVRLRAGRVGSQQGFWFAKPMPPEQLSKFTA